MTSLVRSSGRASREPRAPLGAPILLLAAALAIVSLTAVLPPLKVAPIAVVIVAAALVHRTVLAWRSLVAAVIAVILFIPIRRYTMPGHLPFQLEPYRLMVAVVSLAWLTSLLIDPRVRLRRSGLEKPLFLFVAAALGSVLVNGSRVDALGVQADVVKKLTFFASFFIVFYFVLSVVRTPQAIDFLVKALVGGGAILAVLALYESRTHTNIFNNLSHFIPFLKLSAPPDPEIRGARLRVFASSQHPIALGALFVMLFPLAVYLAQRFARRRWLVAGGLLALGAFSTVSRTSIMMLLVVSIVFFWLRSKEMKRALPALIPVLIVAHVALPGSMGTLKESFFPSGGLIAQQQADAGGRGSGRIADLGPSLVQFERQPILGQGFGTRVVDQGRINALILDDQWLGTLLETGVTGVFAWVWLFRRFIKRLGAAAKEDPSPRGWLLAAIAGSVAAYSIGMFTYDAWSFIQVTFTLFILLGLGSAVYATTGEWPSAGKRADAAAAAVPAE